MDYRLEQWINGPAGHHPVLDGLMVHIASWSEAIFVAVVVVWFLYGWLCGSARDREGAITAFVGALLSLLVNQVIIHIWQRPRPFVAHPHSVHLLLAHSTDPSFPSDHATPAFAIGLVLFAFHRRLGALLLLFAVLMGYARVYVGDHYPADILAGALIGIAISWLLTTRLEPLMHLLRRLADRTIVLLHLPLPNSPRAAL